MNIEQLRQGLLQLPQHWPVLARRFEARTRRERLILIAGGVALLWALADALWLGSLLQQHQRLRAEAGSRAVQRQAAEAEAAAIALEIRQLDESQNQQIAAARQRAAAAQQGLQNSPNGLVSAQQMLPLLQQLLRQGCSDPAAGACARRLRVRSMRSLAQSELSAVAPAAAASSVAAEAALPGLWKHGIEIVLEGGFVDIAEYVQRLEAMPQHLLRGGMSFSVERHPRATLTLRLYTLSLDKGWLEI